MSSNFLVLPDSFTKLICELSPSVGGPPFPAEACPRGNEEKSAGVVCRDALFKSKAGILTELLDKSTFGEKYEDAVPQAMSASDHEIRLRLAARIARQIHEPLSATFDLLRGAGVVEPELAKLEQQREHLRYDR